jgi:hypothetical protein
MRVRSWGENYSPEGASTATDATCSEDSWTEPAKLTDGECLATGDVGLSLLETEIGEALREGCWDDDPEGATVNGETSKGASGTRKRTTLGERDIGARVADTASAKLVGLRLFGEKLSFALPVGDITVNRLGIVPCRRNVGKFLEEVSSFVSIGGKTGVLERGFVLTTAGFP